MPAPRSVIEAALLKSREMYESAKARWLRAEEAQKQAEADLIIARNAANRLCQTVENLESVLRDDSAYLDEVPL